MSCNIYQFINLTFSSFTYQLFKDFLKIHHKFLLQQREIITISPIVKSSESVFVIFNKSLLTHKNFMQLTCHKALITVLRNTIFMTNLEHALLVMSLLWSVIRSQKFNPIPGICYKQKKIISCSLLWTCQYIYIQIMCF